MTGVVFTDRRVDVSALMEQASEGLGGSDFPVTERDVLALRACYEFVTPIEPIRYGRPWCVFASRGSYEWMMHPLDAIYHLQCGICVDGKRLEARLTSTPFYPFIGAWQITAVDRDANVGFIEAGWV